jgi:Peptidase M1 N-terminal domain
LAGSLTAFHCDIDLIASLDVIKGTSKITLNTIELELGTASIYSDELKIKQTPRACTFDTMAQRATFDFSTALPAESKAQFKIGFHGKLTSRMMGYYKLTWEQGGKTKTYALTQLAVCKFVDRIDVISSDLSQQAHCSQAYIPVLG